jgi:hypothetical protein
VINAVEIDSAGMIYVPSFMRLRGCSVGITDRKVL